MKGRITSVAGIILLSAFALWGCPKKTDVNAASEGQKQGSTAATQKAADQSQGGGTSAAGNAAGEGAAAAETGLKAIYFDYNKAFIRNDERNILAADADWLKAHPSVKIKIEGNCDERGTDAYNQALGQRRAASAKKFLTDRGIAANRIALISYGKEKPVCNGHDETCWQKNRRDDLDAAND